MLKNFHLTGVKFPFLGTKDFEEWSWGPMGAALPRFLLWVQTNIACAVVTLVQESSGHWADSTQRLLT